MQWESVGWEKDRWEAGRGMGGREYADEGEVKVRVSECEGVKVECTSLLRSAPFSSIPRDIGVASSSY